MVACGQFNSVKKTFISIRDLTLDKRFILMTHFLL